MTQAQTQDTSQEKLELETLLAILFVKLKEWNRPVAIVGTGESAKVLLAAIEAGNIDLVGIFESEDRPHAMEFCGYRVQPLSDLGNCDPNILVVLATTAQATQLEATLQRIQSLSSAPITNMQSLAEFFTVLSDLVPTLGYEYSKHIFDTWVCQKRGDDIRWPFLPDTLDLKDKTVLEFGPFEGHLSMALMEKEPEKIIALEARPGNYAKVALLKSLMKWDNYELRLGDVHFFPQIVPEKVDVIFNSGVFYHSDKPWWHLKTCMEHCDTMVLCGHVSSEHSPEGRKFREMEMEWGTCNFEVYPEHGGHLAGMSDHSLWFKEEDLKRFFEFYGYHFEKFCEWTNPHGLWICALVTPSGS